ncbi:L,D-transpeptidase family protein [Paraflavitalea sp. CAU 1676]|uniref:L,D-transpeptidase family protein n=1 Tax=Paraflavitalea sp. CAU 1676 TaxID=3032598 RepID=UPI0023DC77BC|nr:L,D-transpeptidase family protein [Paraflavitalea sp. CAU 1676]MDF2189372.1 L,D-transpeptidase family protein [Paraflavitalea sp. CAU 1676]
MRKYSFLCLLLVWLYPACQESPKKPFIRTAKDTLPARSNIDPSIPGNFSTQRSLHFDSSHIHQFLKEYPQFNDFAGDIRQFYSNRQFAYAWFDSLGIIEQAGNLLNRVSNIGDEGVTKKVLYLGAFDTLVTDEQLKTSDRNTPPSVDANAELMLTAQYFYYAKHVWQGLSEKETKALDWFLPRKKIEQDELLDSLLRSPTDSFLADEPLYYQYYKLKDQLKDYRTIASNGGWPTIKADKKKYQLGDTGVAIRQIRQYLFVAGDLPTDNGSSRFDSSLAQGMKSFQRRLGMKEDAVAGPAVLKEMNVPVRQRIEQIMINMERCRWVPAKPAGEYLAINIPDYKLRLYNKDSVLWSMNVVVGQAIHKTVIFYGEMKYVVFSPYWNIPPGILKNEVLPGIRRDPNYLTRHRMEKVGNTYRQKPGPGNSLGQVKFLFPNSYNIYLHDTPSKSLFGRESRAFSHGCIRLAEPKKLAEYLLRNDPSWTSARITQAMNAGKEQYVTLQQPMPVYIGYFTAFVTSDGKLNFRQDVYNRDGRLAKTMMQ